MKKLLAFMIAALMLLPAIPAYAESGVSVYVFGQEITDAEAKIINDSTYLPVRAICEAIGKDVDWINETRSVIVGAAPSSTDETGSVNIYVDGVLLQGAEAVIIDERTYLPVRALCEAIGMEVEWVNETRSVYITAPDSEENAKIRQLAYQVGLTEEDGTIVLTRDEKQSVTAGNTTSIPLKDNVRLGLLVFDAVAEAVNGSISIDLKSYGQMTWDISTQKTRCYVPFKALDRETIEITVDTGKVTFSDIRVAAFDEGSCSPADLRCGAWLLEDVNVVDIPLTSAVGNIGKTYACALNGDYLYCAESVQLKVLDVSGDNPKLVAKLEGIRNGRNMAFANDGNTLVVSARANGFYVIDITEPKAPKLIKQMDALELVSNVVVDGDYLYVCSRYFGIEIYDISDPYNLKFCSVIRGEQEYQNCYVDKGTLYVAVYNGRKAALYNVTDPYHPTLYSTVDVPGNAYGIYASDKVMYVTTSRNSGSNALENGLHNGFAVYDVSNPSAPQLITTARLDGQFNVMYADIFPLTVQGNYLYMGSTFNGLYVYDISNIRAPKRVAQFRVPIYSYEDSFTASVVNVLLPFNREYCDADAIVDFAIADKKIYMAGMNRGLYEVRFSAAESEGIAVKTEYKPVPETTEDNISVDGYTVTTYKPDGMVYAAVKHEGLYYAACGTEGLHVLNEKFEPIQKICQGAIVKDVKIAGGKLFVAAGTEVAVYSLDDLGKAIASYPLSNAASIEVSADGRYILAQGAGIFVLELTQSETEPIKLVVKEQAGGLYYRNLVSGSVSGKYFGFQSLYSVKWYDFSAEGAAEVPTNVITKLSEGNGSAGCGDKCLSIYRDGYVLYDPLADKVDFNELPVYKVSEKLAGKPAVIGNLLVVSKEYDGTVYIVDITDVTKPELITRIDLKGSPDIATGDENELLIPARHSGLLRLTRVSR